mmetsp:Transcript_40332/g.94931  ORF Transcript_40332/g.94931 Transcript_40332/m.94931 type:complete len:359 (+) Transcript_40332:70-1146(+)|eukprot:CAMPEP_0180237546 /NCGR_PEP_ID=MMETSP0987-20121128/30425_1 /TAXON_ID=697907 /ORGANISM="non described non described, Strain CCMP2293" /LENGTH=358 /DNA_ID=CAMNT_0022203955 /DNA_START=55 /DNA_END=1131 /DNA_ORIENTATION=-
MAEGYVVCSIAGCGLPGHNDGNRVACRMNCPSGVAVDAGDGIWVSDRHNHCIRRLPGIDEKTNTGREEDITTIAGRPRKQGFRNGMGRDAQFNEPAGLCLDPEGWMVVVDRENHAIRAVRADGFVKTIAGGGSGKIQGDSGWRDGKKANALFNRPFGIASSHSGSLYVADTGNNSIRKIDTNSETVTTILGEGIAVRPGEPSLTSPFGVCVDGNNCLYVSEWGAHRIRKVAPDGSSTIVMGGDERGRQDGRGSEAQLFHPAGIAMDNKGVLHVADWGNHAVRRMNASGEVITLGSGGVVIYEDGPRRTVSSSHGCLDGPGTVSAFNSPQDVAVDSCGDVYVADWGNHCVRKIEAIGLS